MSFNINQITDALKNLCTISGSTEIAVEKIDNAKLLLEEAIQELNGIPVAGKGALDCLLGCILALEAITGEDEVIDNGG